jgi:hypothetical protein
MNQRPSLRDALARADVAELDEVAGELGRQAIMTALAEVPEPPPPKRYEPTEEEERQRVNDEALRDASWAVEQHRDRLGRRRTSAHDAKVMRQIWELLRSMAAVGNDSDFQ